MITVGSLFSGIGGFDLGLERAGMTVKWQVEIDPFCNKVLETHWPSVKRYLDVKEVHGANTHAEHDGSSGLAVGCCVGATGHDNTQGTHETGQPSGGGRPEFSRDILTEQCPNCLEPVDLICGGFPCQPFSVAGKRKGKEDDRALWGEMFRIIDELRPRWVIGENVAGFINMGLDESISDLEGIGYEVQAFVIPACAVNAPHRRDRVWIVAHASGARTGRIGGTVTDERRRTGESRREGIRQTDREISAGGVASADSHAPHSSRELPYGDGRTRGGGTEHTDGGGDVTDAASGKAKPAKSGGLYSESGSQDTGWDEPWPEVAQRLCVVYDELPPGLVGCLTYPETHGIMGFILLLRRYHYATTEETRPGEVLRVLREAFGEKEVWQCFRGLDSFYETENLWCPVHGELDGEGKSKTRNISPKSKAVQEGEVRTMPDNGQPLGTPQELRHNGQCTCEFDDVVCELSYEIALGEWKNNVEPAENILHGLWKDSDGERFLHEPLSALHKIWRSVTDKEIGSFRWHYHKRDEHRVQKLKALGNAVVPQIPEIFGRAIMEVECESSS